MLVTLLSLAAPGALAAEQEIRLEVGAASTDPGLSIAAVATWLGEERRVVLRDDGSAPGDVAGDGVWTGALAGPPVALLPLRLEVARGGAVTEVWSGVSPVALEGDRLCWSLELAGTPRATRVSATGTARIARAREAAAVTAPIAWACFVLIYVAWLVERALRQPGDAP